MGSRLLFLRGTINEENTGEIIEQILNINLSDDSANLVGELEQNREPIHLHIQSNGGAVLDALALVDIIKNSKTPIYTYVDGYVYSAAVYIFVVPGSGSSATETPPEPDFSFFTQCSSTFYTCDLRYSGFEG